MTTETPAPCPVPSSTAATAGAEPAAIPVIDLAPGLAGAPGAAERAAGSLRDALQRVGFFFVIGHGVPAALVAAVYREAQRAHALPLADKLAIAATRQSPGYRPVGSMVSRASAIDGAKKANQVAALFLKRAESQWPDAARLPGFRETCVAYQGALEALGLAMLPLFARAFGLPPGFFGEAFRDADVTLRLSHYPPVDYDEGQFGLAAHTDSSFMTFLPDNDVAGLEIRPSGHDWTPAPSIPGSFLVNSGDTLKRWTNDRFLSTEHRAATRGRDRYAVPFFMSPRLDHVVECLPTCHGPGDPPRHAPITYRDYVAWFTGQNYHADPAAPPP